VKLVVSRVQDNHRILCYDFGEETQSLSLVPISDLHVGGEEFDEKALVEFLQTAERENYYLILNGDLFDCAICGSRGNVYEATMSPQEALDYCVNLFYPYRDRILCINTGNHSQRINRAVGIDVDKSFSTLLGLKDVYSDTATFLHLQLGKDRHGRRFNYVFYITHGWGNGRTIGGRISAGSQLLMYANANCYILSHTHIKNVNSTVFNEYDIRTKRLYKKNQFIVHSGCFTKSARYSIRSGLRSSSSGAPVISVSGKRRMIKVFMEAFEEEI